MSEDENTSKNTSDNSKYLQRAPQWERGQSGNPKGRPKGSKDGYAACLRRLASKVPKGEIIRIMKTKGIDVDEETTNYSALAEAALISGLAGESWAHELFRKADEDNVGSQVPGTVIFNILAVAGKTEEKPKGITINGIPVINANGNSHRRSNT